uniref:Uncharacterized protein n=1 Tax=Salix viminalis TaxID=40686 RepID=A0A6N2LN53_SALVM
MKAFLTICIFLATTVFSSLSTSTARELSHEGPYRTRHTSKPPRGPIQPPPVPTKPPGDPTKPPTDPIKPPRVPIKPPVDPAKPPPVPPSHQVTHNPRPKDVHTSSIVPSPHSESQ